MGQGRALLFITCNAVLLISEGMCARVAEEGRVATSHVCVVMNGEGDTEEGR